MSLKSGFSSSIANFVVNCKYNDIPKEVVRVLSLSIFDWVCVGNAGINEKVSGIIRDYALEEGCIDHGSFAFGLLEDFPAHVAAIVNGTTSHALDFDDTHFCYVGHPSVAVLPATLALSEKFGLSGKNFLEASIVGLECACRIGSWLGRAHYQQGFHQTATAGTFGSTLGCCKLLELNLEQTLNAIGIASTRASGLKSQFGTMGKPLNAGIAAANGVEAARLASLGFVSRPDGLECNQGFSDTHSGEKLSPEVVLKNLGESFVFESVHHKYHACCHGLHASIEAIHEIRGKSGLKPNEVKSVKVVANRRWESVCNINSPTTGLEAKFSFRQTIAMAINGIDTGTLSNYSAELCKNSALLSLRKKVHVEFSDQVSDTSSTVIIEKTNGQTIEATHELINHVDLDTRESRVLKKGAKLVGTENAEKLWERVLMLPNKVKNMPHFDLMNLERQIIST